MLALGILYDVGKVTFYYSLAGLILGLGVYPIPRAYGIDLPRNIKVSKQPISQVIEPPSVQFSDQQSVEYSDLANSDLANSDLANSGQSDTNQAISDQPIHVSQAIPADSRQRPPSLESLPPVEPPLPPPTELLQSPGEEPVSPAAPQDISDGGICVRKFVVTGSSVFSPEELAQVAADSVFSSETPRCSPSVSLLEAGYGLSFSQLLQARSAVTQYYVERDYITSGAFIPEQEIAEGIVEIQVVEGKLEDIQLTGNHRLNPNYVIRRLERAGASPLNSTQLLEGLQLLQLDPLIETIDAELSAGVQPGTNLLELEIAEADPFQVEFTLDNDRSANVGTFRRGVQISHANLFGQGDGLSFGYTNTNGSDAIDLSYSYPVNPQNGRLIFNYGRTWSKVVNDPFDILNINSNSTYYELTFRQPIHQTPREEFALSLTASRQESEATLDPLNTGEVPFPTRGSDEEGRTRISALRFSQDWVKRSDRQVIAARSQFSLGLDALNSTINSDAPDSKFFAWRGQTQFVRLLAPETLLLVRGDVQLATESLPSLEQISLGGRQTVRGYPQDLLLTDSGALASVEVRLPIYRAPEIDGLLQIAPFLDLGIGWNLEGTNPSPNTLAAVGVGLQWQHGDNFNARIDWGIPLIDYDSTGDSLQENGIYFSINFLTF